LTTKAVALGLALAFLLPTFAPAQTEPSALDQPEMATATFSMGAQTQYGALTFAGGLYLSTPNSGLFGGVSGIEAETLADGKSVKFAGVTDQGSFLTFEGGLDAAGRLVSAGYLSLAPLRDTDGNGLAGKQEQDAEDISKPPDAQGWLVSFERHHRILAYADPFNPDAEVIGLNIPAEVKTLSPNLGMEAIAALPGGTIAVGAAEGRMWLCPPRQVPCTRIHDNGGPGLFFYLTGLDYLPGTKDEMVASYRRPSAMGGFASIIAHVTLQGGKAVVTPLAQLPNVVGNVEGISAVTEAGGYRLYIVTDNNFDPKTPTRLLAFDWRR
jgi:hypothetical protein